MSESLSQEQLINKPVSELLPHSGPMVLIDRITHLSSESIICNARYENSGFFQCKFGVPVPWAVEIIAQACALFVSINQYGSGITQGRLLKCRQFHFRVPFLPYQTEFQVESNLTLAGDSGLWLFKGSISDDCQQVLAQGDLSILVK